MCFFDKYESLCRAKGKSPNAVAKEIGLSSGTTTVWKKKRSIPRLETIKKVADYFHISMESLMSGVVEGEEKPATDGDGLMNEKMQEITRLLPQLTDEETAMLLSQVKGLIQNR